MKKMFKCRRSTLALIGLVLCGVGIFNGINTSSAIAIIVGSVAASNGYEKSKTNNKE